MSAEQSEQLGNTALIPKDSAWASGWRAGSHRRRNRPRSRRRVRRGGVVTIPALAVRACFEGQGPSLDDVGCVSLTDQDASPQL